MCGQFETIINATHQPLTLGNQGIFTSRLCFFIMPLCSWGNTLCFQSVCIILPLEEAIGGEGEPRCSCNRIQTFVSTPYTVRLVTERGPHQ